MEIVVRRSVLKLSALMGVLLFVALLASAFFATPALAASSFKYDGLTCYPVSGGLHVTPAKKSTASVTVPAKIKGKKVIRFFSNEESKLKSVNLKKATNLTSMQITHSKITKLDVSKCAKLKVLDCSYNAKLVKLTVGAKKKLTEINCVNNNLKSLNVSKCSNLKSLSGQGNSKMTALTLGAHKKLTKLSCSSCRIKRLNVTKCPKLKNLSCFKNKLTSLNLANNTALKELSAFGNIMAVLNLSKNTQLTKVLLGSSAKLKSLVLPKTAKLTFVSCVDSGIATLDASMCLGLQRLYCYGNKITSLKLPATASLTDLNCESNQLVTLDLRGCPKVCNLNCMYNKLTTILLSSSHVPFETLSYYGNNIADTSELDARDPFYLAAAEI